MIEHIFVQWQLDDARDRVEVAIRRASSQHRRLLVTLEPWTKANNWVDGGDHLLSEVVDGAYDEELKGLCREIGKSNSEVWIRWGHEMEDSLGRYPWARNDPARYIQAFRYVVRKCRALAPNALFVWSPKGERSLGAFYPGDEHVDIVGVSIYAMDAWEKSFYGKAKSATENLWEKYQRVYEYKKPIIVAELGVYGKSKYTEAWIEDLSNRIQYFPLIRAIVYFNDKEPHMWPLPYGAPNWKVSAPAFFESLHGASSETSN